MGRVVVADGGARRGGEGLACRIDAELVGGGLVGRLHREAEFSHVGVLEGLGDLEAAGGLVIQLALVGVGEGAVLHAGRRGEAAVQVVDDRHGHRRSMAIVGDAGVVARNLGHLVDVGARLAVGDRAEAEVGVVVAVLGAGLVRDGLLGNIGHRHVSDFRPVRSRGALGR